jgi:hypothetical protein
VPPTSYLAPLPGKKKTSARGVSHAHPLLCFKFCFTLFLLASFYQKYKKISSYYSLLVCYCLALLCFLSMVGFFKTKSFWQGGFTEEQQKYYEEHRLSQKGKHLWEQIDKLYITARNVCSTYNVTSCFDKSCCYRRYKHLPFQCVYNDDATISSYINGNYEFYDVEKIEEFIAWKGAFELAYLLENTDDAPFKYEVYDILNFCFDNYKEENGYILKYLNRCSPTEETNALKEPMEG